MTELSQTRAEAAEPVAEIGMLRRMFGAIGENPYYRLYWTGTRPTRWSCRCSRWPTAISPSP